MSNRSITTPSSAPRIATRLTALMTTGVTLLSLFAAGASAQPKPTGLFLDDNRLPGATMEVDSIRGIETLSDWNTLDTKNLTLRVNHAYSYLLTLDAPCEQLRGAQLVGVSMTNQEIWADFDHIAADGHECRIDRITRLGRG